MPFIRWGMSNIRVFTLRSLNEAIQRALSERVGGQSFWVQAEIASINTHRSGHVYLELVDERQGMLVAKAQGVIWRDEAQAIRQALGPETDRVLAQGSEIQCRVSVDYHLVYGLKLLVREVNLAFNLGQLEQRKRETLLALKKAGLLTRNGMLPMPTVVQRLAVIAAPASAGLADFAQQLLGNSYGYRFAMALFPTRVQGEGAGAAIAACLAGIDPAQTDAVVLVRGGGAQLDLDAFNDRTLAEAIAHCPVPVITGIGHETDRTVADETAHTSIKTPTAAAAFLLDRMAHYEADQREKAERIRYLAVRDLKQQRGRMETWTKTMGLRAQNSTARERANLHALANRMAHGVRQTLHSRETTRQKQAQSLRREAFRSLHHDAPQSLRQQAQQLQQSTTRITQRADDKLDRARRLGSWLRPIWKQEQDRLASAAKSIRLLDPAAVLAKGYALVRIRGQVPNAQTVFRPGDELDISLQHGHLEAAVTAWEARAEADAANPTIPSDQPDTPHSPELDSRTSDKNSKKS